MYYSEFSIKYSDYPFLHKTHIGVTLQFNFNKKEWAQYYNGSLTIMLFPVDEQPASIARLGLSPTVSTHREFRQGRSVILQLGLANAIQLVVGMDIKKNILLTLITPSFNNLSKLS